MKSAAREELPVVMGFKEEKEKKSVMANGYSLEN